MTRPENEDAPAPQAGLEPIGYISEHAAKRLKSGAGFSLTVSKNVIGNFVVPISLTPPPQPQEMVTLRLTREQFEELRLGALGIRTYMPDSLPAGEDGKIHFARALAEAAAEAIESALAATAGKSDA